MKHERLDLDQIGLRAGTDKSSSHHDYLKFYEPFFARYRDGAPKVLEIGIFDGASLAVWAGYFENGPIIGADIDSSTRRFATDRVTVEILDQSNIEELVSLGVKHGPFDIVIEDGSHMWEHQITTLRTLFPFVREGGIYVVEDLQTNFGAEPRYRGVSTLSCVEYLKKAVDLRIADNAVDISEVDDPFLRTYARSMTLSFYRGCCLIQKGSARTTEKAVPPGEPLVSIEQQHNKVDLSIVAHVGGSGDVRGDSGFVRAAGPRQNIQGFVLDGPSEVREVLQYRARLDDGSWTDWVPNGRFAGTRGQARDLTGFSVRLSGGALSAVGIQAIGLFRGESDPISVSEGQDCAPGGAGELHAMQVILWKQS
jgi:hypothetical protein